MRTVFLLGGFTGFTLALLAGVIAGRQTDLLLRDAALACLAGALLFRWFWGVLLKSMSVTLTERLRAERAAEQAAAAATAHAPKSKPSASAAA